MWQIIISICGIIGTVYLILQCYQVLFLAGFFKKTTYKKTENFHTYGICIPARNESKVIRNILESIENQDYDKEKLTIFVIADNCTDSTAEIVREYSQNSKLKIVVYEHNNKDERTKGYALRYLFEQIKQDYGSTDCFDGYFVFDADNVLKSDYITRMNEAFDAGNEVVTSFRNTKNFAQNWISFSYAIHWLRTCLFEHRGKDLLKLSCRIQGTGFVFANRFVENGWNYTSLTEDRAFCTDVVVKGYKVAYCEDAKFYDEQPYNLKISFRQRIRWSKGHLQSAVENEPKLIKNVFKFSSNSVRSYDIFWLNFPGQIESGFRKIITWICQIVIAVLAYTFWGGVLGILKSILISYLTFWLTRMLQAIITYIFYRKEIEKMSFAKLCWYILLFPLFDEIGKWSMYIALFKKVEWKPIPHDYTMDINKLKK